MSYKGSLINYVTRDKVYVGGGKSENIWSVTQSESGKNEAWCEAKIHQKTGKNSVTRLIPAKSGARRRERWKF